MFEAVCKYVLLAILQIFVYLVSVLFFCAFPFLKALDVQSWKGTFVLFVYVAFFFLPFFLFDVIVIRPALMSQPGWVLFTVEFTFLLLNNAAIRIPGVLAATLSELFSIAKTTLITSFLFEICYYGIICVAIKMLYGLMTHFSSKVYQSEDLGEN